MSCRPPPRCQRAPAALNPEPLKPEALIWKKIAIRNMAQIPRVAVVEGASSRLNSIQYWTISGQNSTHGGPKP